MGEVEGYHSSTLGQSSVMDAVRGILSLNGARTAVYRAFLCLPERIVKDELLEHSVPSKRF